MNEDKYLYVKYFDKFSIKTKNCIDSNPIQ